MKNIILKFGLVQGGVTAINGVIAPIMFLLFMDKGLGLLEMGMLLATSTLCVVLFEIPFGSLADNFGRKKVFLMGESILILVMAGFWLAESFYSLMFFMALNGISTALFSGTLDALFVERFNEKKKDTSMNLLEAQASLGSFQVLGLALGATTAGLIPGWFESITSGTTLIDFYEINLVILLPFLLIHMLVTYKIIDESSMVKNRQKERSMLSDMGEIISRTGKELASCPILKVLLVMDFLGGVSFITLEQLWQPMLSEIINEKESTWMFGIIYALNFVCLGIGQGLSIPVAKLFKNHYAPMLIVCEFIIGGLFIVFAFQGSLSGFITVYLVLHLFTGMAVAPNVAMFHEKVKEEQRSTMLSVKSLITQAGALGGALMAGYIANKFGIATAWILAGIVTFISALFYLVPAIITFSKEMAVDLYAEEARKATEAQVENQAQV
jgi:MFS family permease